MRMLYAATVAVVFGAMFAGAAQAQTMEQRIAPLLAAPDPDEIVAACEAITMHYQCTSNIIRDMLTIALEFPDHEPDKTKERKEQDIMAWQLMRKYPTPETILDREGRFGPHPCELADELERLLDTLRAGQ